MTARSTRDKIRWGVEAAAKKLEVALQHLKHSEEMADGRSQEINEYMPYFVRCIEEVRQGLIRFRDTL